jgi:DNA polymerase II
VELSRICSSWKRGHHMVNMYGYNENGDPISRTDRFDDYFFVDADNADIVDGVYGLSIKDPKMYTSLYGVSLRRVECSSIKSKNQLSKKYAKCLYEADIDISTKYLNDNKCTWSTKRNLGLFDIETWLDPDDNSANQPTKAQMPVTSIVIYISSEKRYYILSWHPEKTKEYEEPKEIVDGDKTYLFCRTEEEVLLSFIYLVESHSVDILSGWWSSGYDMPYIINRCTNLGIDYTCLSPVNEVQIYKKKGFWRTFIKGLDHVDMLEGVKDLGFKFPNWKLSTIAKHVLKNEELEKETEYTWRDWLDNYEGFIKYAFKDVEIMKEIEESLHIFDLYVNLQQFSNINTLSQVFMKSMIVDSVMIKEYRDDLKFPNRIVKKKQSYAGAIVLDPTKPGLTEDVSILDYTSLYPTTIMAYNLSPETFICSEQDLDGTEYTVDDICEQLKAKGVKYIDTGYDDKLLEGRYLFYAQTEKVGLVPKMIRKLFNKRKAIQARMATEDLSSEEYTSLFHHQKVVKLIMNSVYGAFGFNHYRLYKPQLADAITFFARKSLLYAIDHFNELGHQVLYGDTDSAMICNNGKSIDEIESILETFNSSLATSLIGKYNSGLIDEYNHVDLKYEKNLDRIYFGDVKKRYYCIVNPDKEVYVKGMTLIRKDAPLFVQEVLQFLTRLAVYDKLTVEHLTYVRSNLERVSMAKLGIPKSFGKQFKEYIKTTPQHIKASLWANELFDSVHITSSDVPYMFYVKSNCEPDLKKNKRHNAICIPDDQFNLVKSNSELFEIDYDVFMKKQILEQMKEFSHIATVKKALEEYAKA